MESQHCPHVAKPIHRHTPCNATQARSKCKLGDRKKIHTDMLIPATLGRFDKQCKTLLPSFLLKHKQSLQNQTCILLLPAGSNNTSCSRLPASLQLPHRLQVSFSFSATHNRFYITPVSSCDKYSCLTKLKFPSTGASTLAYNLHCTASCFQTYSNCLKLCRNRKQTTLQSFWGRLSLPTFK